MTAEALLQEIFDSHGSLTPALVVAVASDPAHELHARFTWDDSEAARRWRLVQAQGLIRSVTVVVDRADTSPVRVRAWVSSSELDQVGPPDGVEGVGIYRPVRDVAESDVWRTAWLRSLERDWRALRRRAGASEEFAAMVLADIRPLAG